MGGVSSLKRLLFESQTQLMAVIREQITNPEPTIPKRVPQAEREIRLENLRRRLGGVLIEGHSEPSHALLDLATQLYDQNILKIIPIEKCYSRLTELTMAPKTSSKLLEIESSKVVVKDRDSDHEVNVQSSYQALESLKRRGLAMDFAGIMSYTKHDKYIQVLFSHLNREPPAGYNRCSLSQLLAADRAAWTLLTPLGPLHWTPALKRHSNHMKLALPFSHSPQRCNQRLQHQLLRSLLHRSNQRVARKVEIDFVHIPPKGKESRKIRECQRKFEMRVALQPHPMEIRFVLIFL